MRTCGRCQEEKPMTEFRKRGLGHSVICQICIVETSEYKACKHCGGLTDRGDYCSKKGCKLTETGATRSELVRIDCEKCDGYREVSYAQVQAALPLCDDHMRLRHNAKQRIIQGAKRKKHPKRLRIECEKCDNYRMVNWRNRNSALPLCAEHLHEHEKYLARVHYQKIAKNKTGITRDEVIPYEEKGRLIVIGGTWPRLSVLPMRDMRQTLEDGNYPPNMVFKSEQTGKVYRIEGKKPQRLVPAKE